jgi:hypothetical protein
MSDTNPAAVAARRSPHDRGNRNQPTRPNVEFYVTLKPDQTEELLPKKIFEDILHRMSRKSSIEAIIVAGRGLKDGSAEVKLVGRFRSPSDPSIVPTSDEIAGFVRSIFGDFAETSTNGSSLNFKAEPKDGMWPKKRASAQAAPVEVAASQPQPPAKKAPGLNFEVVIDRDRSRAAIMSSSRFLENLSYVARVAGLSFEVRGKHRMSNAEQISLTARFASAASGVPGIDSVHSVIERSFDGDVDVRRDGNEFQVKSGYIADRQPE